ncbi:MAG: response regulator, partial [Clostridia bacterium]|nr:response regulator [Clostridia bacterium]
YGFQTTASIRHRHPEHLIIHSEGCYYLRLPFNLNKIKSIVVDEVNNLSRIRKHLAAGFNMEVFRHKFANQWGVGRLKMASEFVLKKTVVPVERIDSKEELIAKFIYASGQTEDAIDPNLLNQIQSSIQKYRNYIHTKKILYIDDQANNRWSETLQEVLNLDDSHFLAYSYIPADNQSLIACVLDKIRNFNPDCVLLDLRLRPNDELLNFGEQYTGAIVAEEIKNKYVSLPVIMFTASNKVENLRVALRSGCETLWTKEGIDEYQGINYSLKNYFRLVKAIYESCKHFDSYEAKLNYKTDKLLEEIEKRIQNINDKWLKKSDEVLFFNKYGYIIPDSNFFFSVLDYSGKVNAETSQRPIKICNIFVLMLICNKLVNGPRFHFNDEVFLELLRFSKMRRTDDQKKNLKIDFSRYIISKIYFWNYKKIIDFNTSDLYAFRQKLRAKDENWGVLFDNDEIKEFNHKIHADEIFVKSIPNLISTGEEVLFITDDKKCAWDVGRHVCGGQHTIKKSRPYQGSKTINEEVSNGRKVVYKQMTSLEVHPILNNVRKKIMEIEVFE